MDHLAEIVESYGGRVESTHLLSGTITAEVPTGAIGDLAAHPIVSRIDLVPNPKDDGAGYIQTVTNRLDGIEIGDLLQNNAYWVDGYNGAGQTIAVVESDAARVFANHPGFGNRHENCLHIFPSGSCSSSNPTTGAPHGTAVASVILGSILDGEDSGIPSSIDRRKRSGVATGALGFGLGLDDYGWAVNRMLDPANGITLSNNSWSDDNNDPTCRGTSGLSKKANSLFEGGIAVFKSAGNMGAPPDGASGLFCGWPTNQHGSNDCRIGSPGSAVGVFTVGGYQAKLPTQDSKIYQCSARGGSSVEGGGRTIVDVLAPTNIQYPYPHYDRPETASGTPYYYGVEWPGKQGPGALCCTSGSTPVATGAAAIFRSWFEDAFPTSSFMDDPGALYANMLLMGDMFEYKTESHLLSGYSNRSGAGRLRLRQFDSSGLKAPFAWSSGSRCVTHGQSTTVILNGGTLNPDVDVIRATAYFYDTDHDQGGSLSGVSMFLEREIYPGGWTTVRYDTSGDHKLRVAMFGPPANTRYRIRFHGTDVAGATGGCGTNRQRVHWAYFFESSDRTFLDVYRPEGWIE